MYYYVNILLTKNALNVHLERKQFCSESAT